MANDLQVFGTVGLKEQDFGQCLGVEDTDCVTVELQNLKNFVTSIDTDCVTVEHGID